MAVTQYIGARYVPIFADPIEWSNTKQYEPLTIVTHEGNSYTSRQFVPVGIDISRNEYWALTGNYDAQIEQYRRDVEIVRNSIDTVNDEIDSINGTITELNDSLESTENHIEMVENSLIRESGNDFFYFACCQNGVSDKSHVKLMLSFNGVDFYTFKTLVVPSESWESSSLFFYNDKIFNTSTSKYHVSSDCINWNSYDSPFKYNGINVWAPTLFEYENIILGYGSALIDGVRKIVQFEVSIDAENITITNVRECTALNNLFPLGVIDPYVCKFNNKYYLAVKAEVNLTLNLFEISTPDITAATLNEVLVVTYPIEAPQLIPNDTSLSIYADVFDDWYRKREIVIRCGTTITNRQITTCRVPNNTHHMGIVKLPINKLHTILKSVVNLFSGYNVPTQRSREYSSAPSSPLKLYSSNDQLVTLNLPADTIFDVKLMRFKPGEPIVINNISNNRIQLRVHGRDNDYAAVPRWLSTYTINIPRFSRIIFYPMYTGGDYAYPIIQSYVTP